MEKNVKGKKILTLSKGNTKLVSNDKQAFLIWNLPAEVTCPQATELCKKYCYAKKSERMYENTRTSRQQQYNATKSRSFVKNMCDTIDYYSSLPSIKGKKIFFRWHESGDIFNSTYFRQIIYIALRYPNITFLAYTKSINIVNDVITEGYTLPSNLIIRFSIWKDTKTTDLSKALELNLPTFTALPLNDINSKKMEVCCGSCKYCKKCYSNEYKHIAIAIH